MYRSQFSSFNHPTGVITHLHARFVCSAFSQKFQSFSLYVHVHTSKVRGWERYYNNFHVTLKLVGQYYIFLDCAGIVCLFVFVVIFSNSKTTKRVKVTLFFFACIHFQVGVVKSSLMIMRILIYRQLNKPLRLFFSDHDFQPISISHSLNADLFGGALRSISFSNCQ